jgi:hypothetical protein
MRSNAAVILALALISTGSAPATRAVDRPAQGTLEELYRAGTAYPDFLAAATNRKELWHSNWERAAVPDALVERARAVPGRWRLLAIAVDGCSDSVNTIPYIAKLVELVDGLELRIVDSTAGRELMEAHRTPDGRAATPTIILIREDWTEAGAWIERPSKLQTWYIENKGTLESSQLFEQKMKWYDEDRGAETVREIVELIEHGH